ncbi:hypothetical protein GN958_ATG12400, partial [Phytophthora infestans]
FAPLQNSLTLHNALSTEWSAVTIGADDVVNAIVGEWGRTSRIIKYPRQEISTPDSGAQDGIARRNNESSSSSPASNESCISPIFEINPRAKFNRSKKTNKRKTKVRERYRKQVYMMLMNTTIDDTEDNDDEDLPDVSIESSKRGRWSCSSMLK